MHEAAAVGRFCYIVMAHHGPSAVNRLVRRIKALSPTSFVLVRFDVDGRFDVDALRGTGAEVLSSDIAAQWGAWSLVQAQLEALEYALTLPVDYLCVISGQDYPMRRLATWERALADSGIGALLRPSPSHRDDTGYRWAILQCRRRPESLSQRVARRAAGRCGVLARPVVLVYLRHVGEDYRWWIGFRRRRSRTPIPPMKASQWVTLSRSAVETVLRMHRSRPELSRYFATVRIPDEYYISSLVHASGQVSVSEAPTSAMLWTPGASSPRELDDVALRHLHAATPAPFARKLGVDAPESLVRLADAMSAELVESR